LKNRVGYIVTQKTSHVKKYKDNPNKLIQFEKLKERVEHFSTKINSDLVVDTMCENNPRDLMKRVKYYYTELNDVRQKLMKSIDDMIVQYEKDDNDSCYGDSCGYNS